MKYYRTPLSKDLLQLIGEFCGSEHTRLRFSITPKRKFLGRIYVQFKSSVENRFYEKRLKTKNWHTVRIGTKKDVEKIREYICIRNLFLNRNGMTDCLTEVMSKIEKLLSEIQNYALCYR